VKATCGDAGIAFQARKYPTSKEKRHDPQGKGSLARHGRDGSGNLSSKSGVLAETPYSFKTRFENEKGTNPGKELSGLESPQRRDYTSH